MRLFGQKNTKLISNKSWNYLKNKSTIMAIIIIKNDFIGFLYIHGEEDSLIDEKGSNYNIKFYAHRSEKIDDVEII